MAYSLTDIRNVNGVPLPNGSQAIPVAIVLDETGGGGGIATEVDANLQVGEAAVSASNPVPAGLYTYNGSAWEPYASTREITIFPSASYSGDQTSVVQTNTNARGIMVFITVGANSTGINLTPNIAAHDPVSGNYKVITSNYSITSPANNTYIFLYYPENINAGNLTQVVQLIMPRTWKLLMYHSLSGAITYSVGGVYLM